MHLTRILMLIIALTGCATTHYKPPVQSVQPVVTPQPAPVIEDVQPSPALVSAPAPVPLVMSTPPRPEPKRSVLKMKPAQLSTMHKAVMQVDEIEAQLTSAAMQFTVPKTVNINDPIHISLAIDPTTSARQLVISAPSVIVADIKISKIVEAQLLASDFTVIAISPVRQAMSTVEPTIWEWRLTGAKPGSHDIHLSINAIVSIDHDRAEKTVKTFEETVKVEITTRQWLLELVKQYWQWVWSTLLLPAGVWLWKKWKAK